MWRVFLLRSPGVGARLAGDLVAHGVQPKPRS
jgi:hypothetical protein